MSDAEPKKRKTKVKEVVKIPLHIFEGDNTQKLTSLYEGWENCNKCDLHNYRNGGATVFGDGNPSSKILIVGEAPGEEEAESGVPFIGASGRLLNQILAKVSDDTGIQELSKWYAKAPRTKDNEAKFHSAVQEWRGNEFFITNVVGCRPPENRTPTSHEVDMCWERLWNIVYTVDPWITIAVGRTALQALLKKKTELIKNRGQVFDAEHEGRIGKMRYTVIPVFHPSYLLRKADWKVSGGDFEKTVKDFYMAFKMYDRMREQNLGVPIPYRMEP